MLNSEKYREFLNYDQKTKIWAHKETDQEWEAISLELHENYNDTVETEINHPGLVAGYIEDENKYLEEKVQIMVN